MKWTLLLTLIGKAAGENCLGSTNIEPTYCNQQSPETGANYCINQAIKPNDIVPLSVNVRNDCHYNSAEGIRVYVPAKLQAGKKIQVVLACTNIVCNKAYDHMFEFTNYFEPGEDPAAAQAITDWRANGKVGPRPARAYLGEVNCDPATDASCKITFGMGTAPGFGGSDYCGENSGLSAPDGLPAIDRNKACAYYHIHEDVRRTDAR